MRTAGRKAQEELRMQNLELLRFFAALRMALKNTIPKAFVFEATTR
jgi:hypothetical protein